MAYDPGIAISRTGLDTQMTERPPQEGAIPQDAGVPAESDTAEQADGPTTTAGGPDAAGAKPVAPNSLDRLKATLDGVRSLLSSAPERASTYTDLYVYCSDLLRLVEAKIREVEPGAEITPEQLESVCILLGPYRNLTTLTCSVLSLHPQCVVLNHAGLRTLKNRRLNFLANYTPDKFGEFVRYAGFASRGGMRGTYGGDIRLSHAFDREPMQQAHARLRSAGRGPARCLVWKDSHLVTNFLRSARVDVPRLLQRNDKLRFLLPIRNPIDCAISNLRMGHVKFFGMHHAISPASPLEDVVAAVLDEIAWFLALREGSGRPERFFLYFEHAMGRAVLEQLLQFLGLPADEAYLAVAAEVFEASGERRKEARIVDLYADQVRQKFSRYPEMRDALLRFAQR